MNLNRKPRPLRFEGEIVNTIVTFTTNVPVIDARAILRSVDPKSPTACDLRIVRTSGCEVDVLLEENAVAQLCEGHFELVLMEGCDECGVHPVVIDADCYVTGVSTQQRTEVIPCGKC